MNYTPEEYTEMLIMFGEYGRNARETSREYALRFPNRRHPNPQQILHLINRARETGNLVPVRRGDGQGGGQNELPVREEEAILNSALEDPSIGIRGLAAMHGRSYTTCQRVLKKNHLHGYHFLRVHQLDENDFPRRLQFCNWLLGRHVNDPDFVKNILFTDECTFTRDGIFNSHNWHHYAFENPHATLPTRSSQNRFSVNFWCGIVGEHLVSSPFLNEFTLNLILHLSNTLL